MQREEGCFGGGFWGFFCLMLGNGKGEVFLSVWDNSTVLLEGAEWPRCQAAQLQLDLKYFFKELIQA